MFTGIVEEIGTVAQIQKGRHSAVLTIHAERILEDMKIGDSISVNGVCLTVTSFHLDQADYAGQRHSGVSGKSGDFTADVMHETLSRSALSQLRSGSHVNLERAMRAEGRFGGHMVAGHVDGVGRIVEIKGDDTAVWYTIQTDPIILRYIIEKGSVTIDGISLTVARLLNDRFSISAIPHTVQATNLKERKLGDQVNLENDMIGKYVEKLLHPAVSLPAQSNITTELLIRYGY